MSKEWTAEQILALGRSYQAACVLAAAADLELFDALTDQVLGAVEVAARLETDLRATTILLDALAALELVEKRDGRYALPAGIVRTLTARGPQSVLAMTQHQANCLRRWVQLARVARTGRPAVREPSVRGVAADEEAFITAMDNISGPLAASFVAELPPLEFAHLLDVGGASGTWTIAFLRAYPVARATLFDLPHVMPLARQRLAEAGVLERVRLVPGDFERDSLPGGANLAWVSAIVHQNSRAQNRRLFAAVRAALSPGGAILIRDILMEPDRTAPAAGALFAINMLVGTEQGGTFTFAELNEDLGDSGFAPAEVLRRDPWMNSVIRARRAD